MVVTKIADRKFVPATATTLTGMAVWTHWMADLGTL